MCEGITVADVSVIIPVYNVERYLKECEESVIGQTWKNIEIIFVDDGSTDNSGKMCDEIAAADKRVKVIHQKNQGLSAARNVGMEVATGEYILFVDSDDFIEENLVKEIFSLAKKYDADIVNFGSRDIGNKKIESVPSKFVVYDYVSFLKHFYELEYSHSVWSKMFRREFLRKNSIRFLPLVGVEDACFNYQTWEAEISAIVYQPEVYYHHRTRQDSIVHKYNPKLETDEYERVLRYHRLVEKISPEKEWPERTYLCCMYAALFWCANLSYGRKTMPFRVRKEKLKKLCEKKYIKEAINDSIRMKKIQHRLIQYLLKHKLCGVALLMSDLNKTIRG